MDLLNQIEEFAGRPVEFSVNPHQPSPTDPRPMGPAASCTAARAQVFLRVWDVPDPHGITHELLHIHRYWVAGIPQLEPTSQDASHWAVTSSIENDLEHLKIVPKEADFGFDPYPHWDSITAEIWAKHPWPDMTEPFARRKNHLFGWLIAQALCSDDGLKAKVSAAMEREGLLGEAKRLRNRIAAAADSKALAVAAVVKALRIPRSEVRLMFQDPRTQSTRYSLIPKAKLL